MLKIRFCLSGHLADDHRLLRIGLGGKLAQAGDHVFGEIYLPRSRELPSSEKPVEQPETSESDAHGKVLVVEDNPQVAGVTVSMCRDL